MGRALSNPKYLAFKDKCNLSRALKPWTDRANSGCAGFGRMFTGLNNWAENNRVVSIAVVFLMSADEIAIGCASAEIATIFAAQLPVQAEGAEDNLHH